MLTKVLLVGLILALMGAGLWAISFIGQTKSSTSIPLLGTTLTSNNSSLEKRITDMEVALGQVVDEIKKDQAEEDGSSDITSPSDASIESRVKVVESTLTDLRNRVRAIETGTSSTNPTTKKSPAYIPLGWTGSSSGTDWNSVTGATFLFDPADYPGYTSAQFEASIRVYQGNGRAYARMINKDTTSALINSEVSIDSENYTWVTSSTFSLNGSKQTYQLQLKTSTGYASEVANARLRINF